MLESDDVARDIIVIVAEQVDNEKIKLKKQLDDMSSQLTITKHELAQSKKAEQSLVEQQNQMSIELIAEKRERDKATVEVKRLQKFVNFTELCNYICYLV